MQATPTAVSAILMLALLTASCSDKAHPTYTIAQKGVLIRDENFDVIHVYGFTNNGEIARQIAGFLNESEPNTYHYYQAED